MTNTFETAKKAVPTIQTIKAFYEAAIKLTNDSKKPAGKLIYDITLLNHQEFNYIGYIRSECWNILYEKSYLMFSEMPLDELANFLLICHEEAQS